MNGKLTLWLMILLSAGAKAQEDKRSILKGNEYYRQQEYDQAATYYQQSLGSSENSTVGKFNLGAAWYKQQKLDDAIRQFSQIAESSSDKSVKAKAYHNLGNALLESQKLEESIDAYKKSLLNNPKDDETRYNLAYVQEKLKQQQNQPQQDPSGQQDNDKGGQDQNDNRPDNDHENDQNDRKDDKKNDQKDKNSNQADDQKQNKGQQPSPQGQLSKAEAERLLEAMSREEKNTQDKLKKKKDSGSGKVAKQW